MVYKFCIVSDEVANFKLEILIDSEDTFYRLRNTILDAVGYTKDQPDSFFVCNDDWEKEQEITLVEMDTDSDVDSYLMEDTHLDELVEDEGQRLLYVFDYLNDRCFFMEMKEIIYNKDLRDPLCQRKEGKAPEQMKDIDIDQMVKDIKAGAAAPAAGLDMDDDFYGDEGFDDDELAQFESLDDQDL